MINVTDGADVACGLFRSNFTFAIVYNLYSKELNDCGNGTAPAESGAAIQTVRLAKLLDLLCNTRRNFLVGGELAGVVCLD
jgi:hypothetical protein